jgi:hypothetical protein
MGGNHTCCRADKATAEAGLQFIKRVEQQAHRRSSAREGSAETGDDLHDELAGFSSLPPMFGIDVKAHFPDVDSDLIDPWI